MAIDVHIHTRGGEDGSKILKAMDAVGLERVVLFSPFYSFALGGVSRGPLPRGKIGDMGDRVSPDAHKRATDDLSRMVATVRGHVRRTDRKKVHKNTFYRAVQGLCEKGYLKRATTSTGVRLLARGRKVIEKRELSWGEEIAVARRTERRLLRRQTRWKQEGKVVGGRH